MAARLLAAIGALVGAASPLVHAASISWSGTAASSDWATGSNWVGGTAPSASDVAVFDQGGYANQPNAGTSSVGGILVGSSSAPVTIGGTSLMIGAGGVTVNAGAGTATFSGPIKLATGFQRWEVGAGSTLALARIGAGGGADHVYGPEGAIAIISASGTKTTTNVNGWDWRGPADQRTGLLGPGMVIDNGDGTYDWASSNGGVIGVATYFAAGTGDRNNVSITSDTTLNINASWASLKVSGSTFTANGNNLYIDTGIILQSGGAIAGTAPLKSNQDGLYVYTPDSGTIANGVQDNGTTARKLYKVGAGALTLSGVNTYTGDTVVHSGGSLTLADSGSLRFVIGATGVNNKVTGAGGLTVDGDFVFDLAGAGASLGDSWQIVDVSTLDETFGPTFSVSGFTLSGSKWTRPVNSLYYEFDTSTGQLKVVGQPEVYVPPSVTLGTHDTTYAIGSDIVLSVSASGLGTLTYQWYYQADAGSSPTAIPDATGSTLTVPNATVSSGGIYSVIVTDHAAEASGQPATTSTAAFPSISVVPVSELVVSYYRFEEGPSGGGIASAIDSAGDNDLTPVGAVAYSDAGVPYATIPATGTANTLGANFPAAGNNSLVAPIVGTLAETAFTDFTVEAFVRFSDANGVHTIVGRDDTANTGEGTGSQSLFYLQRNGGKFRVELITKDNTNVQVNSNSTPVLNTWYHVAAVGNVGAGTLKLYVNGAEVGSATGFTGLFVPSAGSNTPWTVGRGEWAGNDADFLRGDVDEVRITRAALAPSQFLNSSGGIAVVPPTLSLAPTYTTVLPGADVILTATATSNMGGTLSYQWYKDGVAISGETAATLSRSSVTLAVDGLYSVVVSDSPGYGGNPLTSTAAARLRVLDIPAAGARAIGLNFVGAASSNEPWAAAWSHVLGTVAPTVTAGLYPAANWNNSADVTDIYVRTEPLALQESNGSAAAGASATWSAAGTWSARVGTGDPSVKTPDGLLLHGYIESRAAAGASVTVSSIPYASYDVYVHVAGGTNGEVGTLKIDREGAPTYYYRVFQHDAYAADPYNVPLAMGESLTRTEALSAPPATFVRFAGVTGSDLTITAVDSVLNKNSGGIAAIQIVDRTPAGTAYPLIVTSAPVSKLARGGSNVTFGVTAVSQNSGTLAYQWQKDGVDLSGQTGATLSLNNVTGASSGNYGVTVTETSALGTITTTRTASLVVVDGTRSLLINGDINTAASPTYVGDGILRADGTSSASGLEANATVWNGIIGSAGAATRTLGKESTGLGLTGVTFSYSGADGAEDNTAAGNIIGTEAEELERDYLYANPANTAGITATVGGLQALAGKQVTLYVYAIGKTTKTWNAWNQATVNDTANITLATANNHLAAPAGTTSVYGEGFSDDAGRNIEYNNPIYNGGLASGYVAFTGVVSANGTVSWSVTPDTSAGGGGLAPLVAFQLLVTGEDLAPPLPTGLSATADSGQVSLSWTASSGANSYSVYRSTTSGSGYTLLVGGLGTTSHTDTTVTNGTTYYYVVTASKSSPAAESGYSTEASATPNATVSAIEAWRQTHFGTIANSGEAANTADPDADGQSNLLEYALGTDPKAAGALPVTVARSGNSLTLTFNHVADSSLIYMIEASNDLASWSTAVTYPAFTTTGSTTYTDNAVLGSQPRRFLRLVVTAP